MATISLIVSKIIESQPFVEEALGRGIINYAALAEELQPKIEKELKKKVKASAVMMALRRLSEKLAMGNGSGAFTSAAKHIFRESNISITSGLFEITVQKSSSALKKMQRIHDFTDTSKDILAVTSGIHELTIISNSRNRKNLQKLLENEKTIKTINGLASLTIKIPLSASETVGMFYTVTKALNWENINIVEIVSTLTEMTFIVKEDDVPKAFEVLSNLLKGSD